MPELAPGVRAIQIPSPFRAAYHTGHDMAAEVGGVPLRVRTQAPPETFVISFPASRRPVAPVGVDVLGWLTRADIELLSGEATIAYLAADQRHLTDERGIRRDVRRVDLLAGDAHSCAAIVIRTGQASDETIVRVRPFHLFAIEDDQRTVLRMGPDVRLAPMQNWNRFFGEPGDDLGSRVRHLRFERLAAPRPMRWLDDLELLITPREQISRAVYVSGLYEPCTMVVLRELLKPGATFVDAGANIGLFSLAAARWVGSAGRVVSIEPSQREYGRLRDHVDRNGLTNVTTHRVAAGDRAGSAVLHVADREHSGLNTLEPEFAYASVTSDHDESVEVATVDDLLARDATPPVHVMKIDVEGSEPRVIAGARSTIERDRPALLLEVAGSALDTAHAGRQAIDALLRSCGYVYAAIDADRARVVPSDSLAVVAENVIAAQPGVIDDLLRAFPPAQG